MRGATNRSRASTGSRGTRCAPRGHLRESARARPRSGETARAGRGRSPAAGHRSQTRGLHRALDWRRAGTTARRGRRAADGIAPIRRPQTRSDTRPATRGRSRRLAARQPRFVSPRTSALAVLIARTFESNRIADASLPIVYLHQSGDGVTRAPEMNRDGGRMLSAQVRDEQIPDSIRRAKEVAREDNPAILAIAENERIPAIGELTRRHRAAVGIHRFPLNEDRRRPGLRSEEGPSRSQAEKLGR